MNSEEDFYHLRMCQPTNPSPAQLALAKRIREVRLTWNLHYNPFRARTRVFCEVDARLRQLSREYRDTYGCNLPEEKPDEC